MMAESRLMMNTYPPFQKLHNSVSEHGDVDEAQPLRLRPNPSYVEPPHTHFSGSFDPALCLTPDKRLSTSVQLRRPGSCVGDEDVETSHRVTKVHFDQTVSVHHLSPEEIAFNSPDNSYIRPYIAPDTPPVCTELDISNMTDSEPVVVLASDLRLSKSNLPSLLSSRGSASTGSGFARSSGLSFDGIGTCESKDSKQETVKSTSPLVVAEFGSAGSFLSDTNLKCKEQTTLRTVEQSCILAQPEMNSTLRIGRDIALLEGQKFDINDKLGTKLKQKALEKACLKVNADTIMFPDLISLRVSEDELLSRLADEQLSRVRLTEVSDKEKPEDKISRVPDVMDFFTHDLHRESASVSLIGIPSVRLEPCTADISSAFDLYRHIRTWEKL